MDIITINAMRLALAVFQIASAWKTTLLAKSYLAWKLFKTATPIGTNTPLSALTEADYSGYAPIAVTALNGPAVDSINNAYLTSPVAYFTNNGGGVGNQIFSAGLVGAIASGTAATGTATATSGAITSVSITAGGSGYLSPPKVSVGGGGTGAIVTATITAGVVTALTVVAEGTGYTSPTLTIEPPVELLQGSMLPSPIPMNVSTDALPLVGQLNVPVGQ